MNIYDSSSVFRKPSPQKSLSKGRSFDSDVLMATVRCEGVGVGDKWVGVCVH